MLAYLNRVDPKAAEVAREFYACLALTLVIFGKRGTSVGESCGMLRARLIEKTHRTNLFARAFR